MTMHIGFIIETVVAVLLAVSIGYSVMLDRRLKGLRLGEGELRKTIQELGAATERAERSIISLRQALEESDMELTAQVRLAERRSSELQAQIKTGGEFIDRISRIVGLGDTREAA